MMTDHLRVRDNFADRNPMKQCARLSSVKKKKKPLASSRQEEVQCSADQIRSSRSLPTTWVRLQHATVWVPLMSRCPRCKTQRAQLRRASGRVTGRVASGGAFCYARMLLFGFRRCYSFCGGLGAIGCWNVIAERSRHVHVDTLPRQASIWTLQASGSTVHTYAYATYSVLPLRPWKDENPSGEIIAVFMRGNSGQEGPVYFSCQTYI